MTDASSPMSPTSPITPDVGGMVPGSEAAVCETIFQEGLRLPPVRLVRDGAVNRDVLDIILLNSRTPDERRG